MVTSMTGFGRGTAEGPDGPVTVEIRTVNNRFLDVAVLVRVVHVGHVVE